MRKLIGRIMGLALLCGVAGAQNLKACGGEAGFPAWVKGGIYSGKVGTLPVTMQLDLKDSSLNAYFYASKGLDIKLTPFHSGEQLLLQESGFNDQAAREVVTGCFALTRAGAGLQGRWTTPDVKGPQAVTLTPLDVNGLKLALPPSPALQELRRSDLLSFVKLNRPWVKVGNSLKEPYSGITYPRLSQGSTTLNAFLQDRQLDAALNALDCRSSVAQPDQYTYTVDAQITWQSARLLSLREDIGYYCGGAHPDNGTVEALIDRQTLKPVLPTAIWPRLTPERLKALVLKATTPASNLDDDCRPVIKDYAVDFGAGLTAKGLELVVNGLPHVAAACGQAIVIPYAALKAEANPKSPYYREIYR